MCVRAFVNGEEIDSVGELAMALGVPPVKEACYISMPPPAACLCGVDIEAMAKHAGFRWTRDDGGDYDLTRQ